MSKPYTKAIIGVIVGDKGAGKSFMLAVTIVRKMVEGGIVWSNMKVKTGKTILNRVYSPGGKKIEYCESNPLDWDLLYKLDESLVEGTVAIDELGYFAGSRQSQDTRNKLINACLRQSRHRNLDFWSTAKNFFRVDNYIREEADVLIVCNDLAYSPWGKAVNLEPGTVIHTLYFDLSGVVTGRSVYPFIGRDNRVNTKMAYQDKNWHALPYHDCYDTKEIISLEEAFSGVRIDFKKRVIGNNDREGERAGIKEKILQAIKSFKDMGEFRVPTHVFWDYMKSLGVDGDPQTLGRYVPREVERIRNNGFFYDISGVEI